MHPYPAFRVDKHISAKLVNIVGGHSQPATAKQQLQVRPPRFGPQNPPHTASPHPVGPIKFTLTVDYDRPGRGGLVDITSGDRLGLEGYDRDLHPEPLKLRLPLAQLREMLAAGQSSQMAMKHQQQPFPGEVGQPIGPPEGVGQLKFDGTPTG
jgi:hypothetical protein